MPRPLQSKFATMCWSQAGHLNLNSLGVGITAGVSQGKQFGDCDSFRSRRFGFTKLPGLQHHHTNRRVG